MNNIPDLGAIRDEQIAEEKRKEQEVLDRADKDRQLVDLSDEAIRSRAVQARREAAANWARSMNRTFKGIRGSKTRRGYVIQAIHDFKLMDD